MQARILTTLSGIEAIQSSWRSLFDQNKNASTFCSYEWLLNWYHAYQPAVELRVIVVETDGLVVGIAPLVLASVKRCGIRMPALYLLGDGVESDHTGFLVHPAYSRPAMDSIIEQIKLLPWQVAFLNQIPEGSETASVLQDHSRKESWRVRIDRSACPYRLVPSSYKELLDSMQSRFRSTLRSTRRRLEENHTVQFGLHDSEHEFPEALETLFLNHKSRWQSKGQAGVFEDERRRDFYRRLTPELSRRGWLRFFYLKIDGAIVAQQYCFERDGNVYLLQEGFDYAFADANVGHALRSYVMEWLIDNKKLCYDFLAGISRHKQLWSNGTNYDLRITIARGLVSPVLAIKLPACIESAKAAIKRLLVMTNAWSLVERLRNAHPTRRESI